MRPGPGKCADSLQLPIRPNVLDTTVSPLALMRAEGERVLLTGEGGDDWLAGSLAHWPDLFLSGKWGDLLEHARAFSPGAAPHVLARRLAYFTLGPILDRSQPERLDPAAADFRHSASGLDQSRLGPTDWPASDRLRSDALPLDSADIRPEDSLLQHLPIRSATR